MIANEKNWGSWQDTSSHFLRVLESPWYKLVADLQHYVTILTQDFFETQHIKTLHLPITTGSISSPMGLGSDSLPVEIELFGVKTYLADSMQFMLEYGCRLFTTGAYYLMPSFRGEDADVRHLCQFYHSEAEIPGELQDAIELVNDYIRFLAAGILQYCREDIIKIVGDVKHIEIIANQKIIPQITFDEALVLLNKYALENNISVDKLYYELKKNVRTLTHMGEKALIHLHGGIVWISHYDHASVPFYQAYLETNPTKALNADLLFGIGEIAGAGERHVNVPNLIHSLKEHEILPEEYDWYIQMKEHYPMKTAGFGMGVERFLLWILNHDDIRDCQLLPRFNGINILP